MPSGGPLIHCRDLPRITGAGTPRRRTAPQGPSGLRAFERCQTKRATVRSVTGSRLRAPGQAVPEARGLKPEVFAKLQGDLLPGRAWERSAARSRTSILPGGGPAGRRRACRPRRTGGALRPHGARERRAGHEHWPLLFGGPFSIRARSSIATGAPQGEQVRSLSGADRGHKSEGSAANLRLDDDPPSRRRPIVIRRALSRLDRLGRYDLD